MALPIIDASMLNGNSKERAELGAKLCDGLLKYGMVKMVSHTVPDQQVADVFTAIKAFFKLPYHVKRAMANDHTKNQQRGWSQEGEEKTWWLESNTGDVEEPAFSDNKESLDTGDPADQDFPNKWPPETDLPGFQPLMDGFFKNCGNFCLSLLELLAEALEQPTDTFTSRCTNYASTTRINHFPPINVKKIDSGNIARIWPHKDFGIISLVFPDTTGGLEYEDRSNPGTFLPVEYGSSEEVVVIISETFQRWTNDMFLGGLHRVSKPEAREIQGDTVPERWSLVYFCKADRGVSVAPLPQFINPAKPPAYEDMTALQYQGLRNKTHYPDLAPIATR